MATKRKKGGLKGFNGSTKLASGPQVYSISGFPGSLEDTSKPHFSAVLPPQITPTKLNPTNMTQKDIEVSCVSELGKRDLFNDTKLIISQRIDVTFNFCP